jgi:tRNA 2-thiouridine synthesizing protein C
MTSRNLATTIIIKSPPFGQIDGKEGVDLALVCAAFEIKVNLVFIDEGIFHLIKKQDESIFQDKYHDKQLKALEFYDINELYVELESLTRFSINSTKLLDNVQIVSSKGINKKISGSNNTVIF